MGKYLKNGHVYDSRNGIEHNGFIIFNASDTDILKWGYEKYEPKTYTPSKREMVEEEISELKKELFDTDFIALKSFEGYDCDTLYPGWKQHRKEIRDRINELEQSINDGDSIGFDTE